MTTLTPPSAEQCALIDEAARQEKAGETAANYWYWVDAQGIQTNRHYPNDIAYIPTPAHPHYATYCEWTHLLENGDVENGMYELSASSESTFTVVAPDECKWFPELRYEIHKTRKHPDNVKLKLIDWAKAPVGAMTNRGIIIGHTTDYKELQVVCYSSESGVVVCYGRSLRLLEQTTFTHLPEGTPPPVVEGLVFEYECASLLGRFTTKYADLESTYIGYRVIGCAEGYTDNPGLAK